MPNRPDATRAFIDANGIVAGVLSATGAARAVLLLGEVETVRLSVSRRVLREVEGVLRSRAPDQLAPMTALLDRCRVETVPEADRALEQRCFAMTGYRPDARVLAAAIHARVDYFITFDREHILDNPLIQGEVGFPVGTPGDFLHWLQRAQSRESGS